MVYYAIIQYNLWFPLCIASVIYVFHIASLYDRRGDGTDEADMFGLNSKTALHDVTHKIGVNNTHQFCVLFCILIMYDNLQIGGKESRTGDRFHSIRSIEAT